MIIFSQHFEDFVLLTWCFIVTVLKSAFSESVVPFSVTAFMIFCFLLFRFFFTMVFLTVDNFYLFCLRVFVLSKHFLSFDHSQNFSVIIPWNILFLSYMLILCILFQLPHLTSFSYFHSLSYCPISKEFFIHVFQLTNSLWKYF